ncbi:MAG TPA: hypothetical protein VMV05_03050 [bacterium]|nr:hypothetical protein [bacterium]
MKQIMVVALFLVAIGTAAFLSISCAYDGPSYPYTIAPTFTNTPTTTATTCWAGTPGTATCTPTATVPATSAVTATGGNVFSPSSVTITAGGNVTFVFGGGVTHSLYIDNGAGTCAQSYITWPQTITFPATGTYNFHCQYHSPCGTTSCNGTCTGMVGQVIVQ